MFRTTDAARTWGDAMRALIGPMLMALVLFLGAGSAFAEERVILRRDDFGADLAFIDRFLARSFPDSYEPYDESDTALLTLRHVLVGRHDLSGDGAAELLVYIGHSGWCARSDCELYVFKKLAGQWRGLGYVNISTVTVRIDGDRLNSLNVWIDPKTGNKTVWTASAGFRWAGGRLAHLDDARILELLAESYDFAGMDDHLDAPGRGALETSDFDPDTVRHETDWNRGALRHLASRVGTYRYGAVVNDPAIWPALGEIMDRRELTYVILFMARVGPIHYDRGYLVLEGARRGPVIDDWGNESIMTAMIVVDTRDGSVHAGTRRDRNRRIYSVAENYAGLPAPLYEWLHYGERIDFLLGADWAINVTWERRPARQD